MIHSCLSAAEHRNSFNSLRRESALLDFALSFIAGVLISIVPPNLVHVGSFRDVEAFEPSFWERKDRG